jgi:hypothetical protein
MPRPQAPFVGPAPIETIETEIFGEGGEGTLIAVTLNRGKPSEQWFTMAPELARRLGNALTGLALALPEHAGQAQLRCRLRRPRGSRAEWILAASIAHALGSGGSSAAS